MSQLYNIKGYWSENLSKDFSGKNMWSGQLVLSDDGWFEGIVTDINNPNSGTRYVFGAYFPDAGIELLMFSAPEVSPPLVYRVSKKEQEGYDGMFAALTVHGEHTIGYCRIEAVETKVEDPKLTANLYDWSLDFMLYTELSDLYESIHSSREDFLETVKKKYKNNVVAKEEKPIVKTLECD